MTTKKMKHKKSRKFWKFCRDYVVSSQLNKIVSSLLKKCQKSIKSKK